MPRSTRRRALGFELSEDYCRVAAGRLQEEEQRISETQEQRETAGTAAA